MSPQYSSSSHPGWQMDQRLMLHDICLAARASERTVEYAFHETYGIGVKQYHRQLRLACVRRELWHSPPDVLISEVATRYGFWHLGHFGVAYRSVYGETPRATLLRGRVSETGAVPMLHPGSIATAMPD